jgi:hypothetical protein
MTAFEINSVDKYTSLEKKILVWVDKEDMLADLYNI